MRLISDPEDQSRGCFISMTRRRRAVKRFKPECPASTVKCKNFELLPELWHRIFRHAVRMVAARAREIRHKHQREYERELMFEFYELNDYDYDEDGNEIRFAEVSNDPDFLDHYHACTPQIVPDMFKMSVFSRRHHEAKTSNKTLNRLSMVNRYFNSLVTSLRGMPDVVLESHLDAKPFETLMQSAANGRSVSFEQLVIIENKDDKDRHRRLCHWLSSIADLKPKIHYVAWFGILPDFDDPSINPRDCLRIFEIPQYVAFHCEENNQIMQRSRPSEWLRMTPLASALRRCCAAKSLDINCIKTPSSNHSFFSSIPKQITELSLFTRDMGTRALVKVLDPLTRLTHLTLEVQAFRGPGFDHLEEIFRRIGPQLNLLDLRTYAPSEDRPSNPEWFDDGLDVPFTGETTEDQRGARAAALLSHCTNLHALHLGNCFTTPLIFDFIPSTVVRLQLHFQTSEDRQAEILDRLKAFGQPKNLERLGLVVSGQSLWQGCLMEEHLSRMKAFTSLDVRRINYKRGDWKDPVELWSGDE